MTINEALHEALELLESKGYRSGEIHDNLVRVIQRLRQKFPKAADAEIPATPDSGRIAEGM